jgi:parallel beta-helix repeat protein
MNRRIAAVWICFIFLINLIIVIDVVIDIIPGGRGTTLYVGGAGAGNYSSIQWAIDNASSGDTVFVYNGTYYENVVINKRIDLVGEDRNSTIINGSGSGDVVYLTANFVNITGFTIIGSGIGFGDAGIEMSGASDCEIINIIVTDTNFGIYLQNSHGNKFIENHIISNNWYGLYLYYSDYNIIKDNILTENYHGIYNYCSVGTNITNNTMVNNGIEISGHSLEYWNTHHIDISNTVIGKPLYYWKDITQGIVPQGAGQVILANCNNVTVQNQELIHGTIGVEIGFSANNYIINNNASSNNVWGIYIERSHNNRIIGNNLSHNGGGIRLIYSSNNRIVDNIGLNNSIGFYVWNSDDNLLMYNTAISNNVYGISVLYSSNNVFYYNNLINNSNQANDDSGGINQWDNGYPSGGN